MTEQDAASARSLEDVLPFGPYGVVCPIAANDVAVSFVATFRPAETPMLVALKAFRAEYADEAFAEALALEGRKARRLNHVNVGQTFDVARHDELLYLTTEFVDGVPVSALQAAAGAGRRPVTAEVAAFIAAETCSGIAYAHARRDERGTPLEIVHLGIAPSRLLLSKTGTVKVIDFGVAQVALRHGYAAQANPNWLSYTAPELVRGEDGDARSDVFSIGAVLHHLLTGRRIYQSREGAGLREAAKIGHVPKTLDTDTSAPPGLAEIVDRCLAADPDERYASAGEARSALAAWLRTNAPGFGRHRLRNYLTRLLPEQTYNLLPDERWDALHRKHFVLHDPATLVDEDVQAWEGAAERASLEEMMEAPRLPALAGLDLRRMETGAHATVHSAPRQIREALEADLPATASKDAQTGQGAAVEVRATARTAPAASEEPQRLAHTASTAEAAPDEPIDFDRFAQAVLDESNDPLASMTRADLAGEAYGRRLGVTPVLIGLLLLTGAALATYSVIDRANAGDDVGTAETSPGANAFVSSRPQGAQILLDGVPGAITPGPIVIPEGGANLEVSLAGYASPPPVRVERDDQHEYVLELTPLPHTATITSDPAGASVTYLGSALGVTPVELGPLRVDPREGVAIVVHLDDRRAHKTVTWEPGSQHVEVHVVLEPPAVDEPLDESGR